MPAQSYPIGPFEAIYIGNFGASSKLLRIMAPRTEGTTIIDSMDTEYTPMLNAREQTGDHIYEFTLTFFENEMATRLAKGLPIASDVNTTPGTAQYQLFLVHPVYGQKLSWYFPQVSVIDKAEHGAYKDRASITAVSFMTQNRDANMQNGYQNTVTSLLSTMGGSLAPFSYP